MATDCLFREDAYLKECEATIAAVTDTGGIVLDRTVFYAMSGGQPADRGTLTLPDGQHDRDRQCRLRRRGQDADRACPRRRLGAAFRRR